MPKKVANAELEVVDPTGSTVVTAPAADIQEMSIEQRVQDAMDTGGVTLENHDLTYTGSNQITSGDKLLWRTQLEGESSLSRQWTGMARSPTDVLSGGELYELELEITDFVFTVLSWRTAEDSFENTDVGDMVDTLVKDEASEIGRSQISTVGVSSDQFVQGRKLMDVIVEDLAPIGDALVSQDDTDLIFEALSNVSVKHSLTPRDFQDEIGVPRNDERIVNRARVDGGKDHAVDDEQTTQSSTKTVTDSTRITQQLQARKSEMARIQVYTKTKSSSDDGIVVRLQADRSGSPVDVSDRDSDIARKTLAKDFLASDGYTTFLMPTHTLAPREDPWMIIEADGSNGQDIGTDGSGNPTYKAEYPYPLITRSNNPASQDEYRRRDKRIQDDSLDTSEAVRNKAQSVTRHRSDPEAQVSGMARTNRAHNLSPGEAVDMVDWPVDVSGTYLVLERSLTYDGDSDTLTTELTFQDIDSI